MSGKATREPRAIDGRVPPHNLDAEAVVLSACLCDDNAVHRVRGIVRAEDFYSEANRQIYQAVVDLSDHGRPTNAHLVIAWLRDRDRLGFVRKEYVLMIQDSVPSVHNVHVYADVVATLAAVRRTIAECQKVAAEGYFDIGDPKEWLAAAGLRVVTASETESTADTGATGEEIVRAVVEEAQNPEKYATIRVHTGIEAADDAFGPMLGGHLITVLAWTSMGKTALSTTIAASVAMSELRAKCRGCGWEGYNPGLRWCEVAGYHKCARCSSFLSGSEWQGVLVFSLEMPRRECLIGRMIPAMSGVHLSKVERFFAGHTDGIIQPEIDRITAVSQALGRSNIRIVDKVFTLSGIRSEAIRVAAEFKRKKHPLRLMIVDYWQRIVVDNAPKNASREQMMSEVGRVLKQLAMELGVPVIAPAQLNDDARKDKRRPRASDARESKAIAMDADRVIIIYNPDRELAAERSLDGTRAEQDTDEAPEKVELIYDKNRGGRKGTVLAAFHPSKCLFTGWRHEWEKPAAPQGATSIKHRR